MENIKIQATNIIASDPYKRDKNKKSYFEEYDRLFPFTTESLSSYIKDLDNKSVLCVGSSGDHAIEAFYKGATRVDTFDINRLTNYYQELKLIALKLLEYDEFFSLFDLDNNKNNISLSILEKLKQSLTEDTYELFNYIIRYFGYNDNFLSCRLFYSKPEMDCLRKRSSYTNEDKYYDVKESIKDKDINMINCGLNNLSDSIDKQYDVIYLSNITSYIVSIESAVNHIKELVNHLYENGRIYFAYIYGDDDFKLHPLYNNLGELYKEDIMSIYGDEYIDSVFYIKK